MVQLTEMRQTLPLLLNTVIPTKSPVTLATSLKMNSVQHEHLLMANLPAPSVCWNKVEREANGLTSS